MSREVIVLKKYDIDNLYDTIFDESFLIRYGYYDVEMRKLGSSPSEEDDFDEKYGNHDSFYLKLLNLRELEKLNVLDDLRKYYNFKKIQQNVDTEAIYFNIPKNNYVRREYKMPNLYSYLELVFFIVDNKNEFIDIFKNNKYSTSKFFNMLDFNFGFTKKIEKRLLFGGTSILSLDLSNFYHTLYTHSIPWVVQGKQNSKKNRSEGFANNLDRIIQQCQYGETHGIPTGSMATRIIAEYYMCHIDLKMENKEYKYSRYVDDIKFPYTSDSDRESFLMEFNNLCREYNLVLNDKKTEINTFPFEKNNQKLAIFSYFDTLTEYSRCNTWIKKISEFIEYCLSEESNNNKGAIKCIFSVPINKFKNLKISGEVLNNIFTSREDVTNFNLFEQFLDVSLKDSRLTNKFIQFTEQLINLGVEKESLKKISKTYFVENQALFIKKLKTSKENGWNQEVYQILLYVVIFEVEVLITRQMLEEILDSELDDYSKCLSVILWLKKDCDNLILLQKLEEMLKSIHNTYERYSVRMQEKYWLLRYFIYYLIDQRVIEPSIISKYFTMFQKDINGNYESELHKGYALATSYSFEMGREMNTGRKNINKFYERLLSKNIALVHLGQNQDFKYM